MAVFIHMNGVLDASRDGSLNNVTQHAANRLVDLVVNLLINVRLWVRHAFRLFVSCSQRLRFAVAAAVIVTCLKAHNVLTTYTMAIARVNTMLAFFLIEISAFISVSSEVFMLTVIHLLAVANLSVKVSVY